MIDTGATAGSFVDVDVDMIAVVVVNVDEVRSASAGATRAQAAGAALGDRITIYHASNDTRCAIWASADRRLIVREIRYR